VTARHAGALAVTLLWATTSALTVRAQEATRDPDAQPTFRTGTSAVVLDVVVRDRQGRPVTDLRADEIEVREDGQPVKVDTFDFVRGGTPVRLDGTGPDPLRRITLVTLVFEALSQNARDLARRAALDVLAGERPADQWVSVYRLDQRLRRVQAFTQDADQIEAAIEAATTAAGDESPDRHRGAGATTVEQEARSAEALTRQIGGGSGANADQAAVGAAAGDQATTAILERMRVMVDRAQQEQRGQSSLYPLMALLKAHGTLEGRKALVLFSEGLSVPPNLEEAFRVTVSEANRAGVSVYAVDARGLDPARALDQARQTLDRVGRNSQRQMVTRGSLPVTIEDVMTSEDAEAALRSDSQGTLQVLAEETGGFLVANSNDLGSRLQRVAGDLQAYYEIAYTPRDTALDGRFRNVEVRVARRGVTVQSRRGYFALPEAAGLPLLPYELPMLAAAAATPPPSPFPIAAAAFRFGDTPAGVQHTIVMEVPLSHLTFDEDRRRGQYRVRVTLMALLRDASGAIVERLSDDYPLEGPLDRLPALRQGRLVFRRQVWLPPGTYTLQAVARDQQTERTSVRSESLVVPDAAPGTARLSSLALIRRVEHAGATPDEGDDPFRTEQLRIVPSLGVPIPKATNAQVSAYVVIYPGQGGTPALTFEFLKGGEVIGRASPALDPPDDEGQIKYVASFPTDAFETGTYGLRAVLHQQATTDVAETTFEIVP